MRSNSLDFSSFETMPMSEPPKKTERSHEENQERAYIAASRRTDRSLEARVQSARMASEIHRRRTGKTFRITEDIVMKEEMYEEEDDDLPRSYRLLGTINMQTSSTDMDNRVEAYLSNKHVMSKLIARTDDDWRNNEVNKRFAQLFPQHARLSIDASPVSPPQLPQQVPQQQQQQQQQQLPQQPHSPFPQRPQPVPQQFQSMSSHSDPFPPTQQFYAQAHNAQHARTFSTPALSQCSPPHAEFLRQDSGVTLPVSSSTFDPSLHPDSPMDLGSGQSAFTTELPQDARMMMMGTVNIGADFDSASQTWPTVDSSFDMSGVPQGPTSEEEQVISPTDDAFDMSNIKWDQVIAPMDDSTWNAFINDNAWADGQE